MNIIELFAGAGGLAQGFVNSGYYRATAMYDIFEPARDSYVEFDPNITYKTSDIRCLQRQEILDDLEGRTLHGIIGGPPCQGFSLAGKRLTEAEVNELVLAYGRVVSELKPYFLVMENVPQLLYHPLFNPLIDLLQKDYYTSYAILNAARYGTPQTRHRLFLIAYHKDFCLTPTFPSPTHGKLGQLLYAYHLSNSDQRIAFNYDSSEAILGADPVISREVARQSSFVESAIDDSLLPLVTVGDAISDVGELAKKDGQLASYQTDATSDYQSKLRTSNDMVANCTARKHRKEMLKLIRSLREGGIPDSHGTSRNKKYYSQAYGRLHRDGLARTLTTYFQNAGSGRFLHYEHPRTLSIREAARLQGFPDRFVFHGTLDQQMQLIGNAVPLPLAEAIGKHVAMELCPYFD